MSTENPIEEQNNKILHELSISSEIAQVLYELNSPGLELLETLGENLDNTTQPNNFEDFAHYLMSIEDYSKVNLVQLNSTESLNEIEAAPYCDQQEPNWLRILGGEGNIYEDEVLVYQYENGIARNPQLMKVFYKYSSESGVNMGTFTGVTIIEDELVVCSAPSIFTRNLLKRYQFERLSGQHINNRDWCLSLTKIAFRGTRKLNLDSSEKLKLITYLKSIISF